MVKKRESPKVWRVLGLMTNLGITLAASVFIGYYMGHYLDLFLFHKPDSWMTILFSLFGIAAGFRGVFRLVNQALGDSDDTHEDGGKE
jgi:ATP synthase protein I